MYSLLISYESNFQRTVLEFTKWLCFISTRFIWVLVIQDQPIFWQLKFCTGFILLFNLRLNFICFYKRITRLQPFWFISPSFTIFSLQYPQQESEKPVLQRQYFASVLSTLQYKVAPLRCKLNLHKYHLHRLQKLHKYHLNHLQKFT